MQPRTITVGPLAAASANNICQSQTPAGAIDLTLNGSLVTSGVATLDVARRVLITCAGNETGKTFTIYGTDRSNNPLVETVSGPNATTVYSDLDFKTVTRIAISAAAAGALTVGTNGVASSQWWMPDPFADPNIAMAFHVTGTVNFTIEQTYDSPNDPQNPVAEDSVAWVNSPVAGLVGATTSQQAQYTYLPVFMRITINSGTGSVRGTFLQSGSVPK